MKSRQAAEEIVMTKLGEASGLFMSQPVKGTEIIMPSQELAKIGQEIVEGIMGPETKSISKYIQIVEMGTSASGKTKVWHVRNISREGVDDTPGVIKWHGGWRKYVFHSDYAFYDWDCLRMIADFIQAATEDHKLNGGKPVEKS